MAQANITETFGKYFKGDSFKTLQISLEVLSELGFTPDEKKLLQFLLLRKGYQENEGGEFVRLQGTLLVAHIISQSQRAQREYRQYSPRLANTVEQAFSGSDSTIVLDAYAFYRSTGGRAGFDVYLDAIADKRGYYWDDTPGAHRFRKKRS